MKPSAYEAVQDVLDASSMLTLALSNVTPGTRLTALAELLDGVQQKLSRVNALLTMYPDLTLEFTPGEQFTAGESSEIAALAEAAMFSIPDRLDGLLVANAKDGRVISSEIAAALHERPVTFVWDAAARRGTVDIRPLLYSLLDQIDPHGEDAPGFWGDNDDDKEED
jgi:hypothetical protein